MEILEKGVQKEVLVGVLNGRSGGKCGDPGYQTVYASVYYHSGWIQNTIEKNERK